MAERGLSNRRRDSARTHVPTYLRPLVPLVLLLVCLSPLNAHEIPVDVLIQMFVTPDGDRLRVLVRVPMAAMRDVDYPRRGAEFVDLERAQDAFDNAARLWIANGLSFYEDDVWIDGGRLMAARAALPSDRAFASYPEALRSFSAPPIPPTADVVWPQLLLDVQLEYEIRGEASRFSVDHDFARLGQRVVTVVHFLPPGRGERIFQITGDPGLVRLDPRWHQAAWSFVVLGFEHILDGIDHLLFLGCVILPFRRIKPLVLIVTSFTVAHSITLLAAALDVAPGALWFPPLIETLIAASIVYMAIENIAGLTSVTRRWIVTFAFGLVHGFGFSFALRETLQFAGDHVATSLFAFNVGVELGQLLVLAIAVPLLQLAFRSARAERLGIIIASALICHTAWHWMIDRGAALGNYDWTSPDAATLVTVLRVLIVAVAVSGIVWLVRTRRPARRESTLEGTASASLSPGLPVQPGANPRDARRDDIQRA